MRAGLRTAVAVGLLTVLVVGQPAVADTPRQRLAAAQERLDALTRELEIQIEDCNLRREQRKAADRELRKGRRRYERTTARLRTVGEARGDVIAQLYKDSSAGRQLAQLAPTVDSLGAYAERVAWLDITRRARTSTFEHYTAAADRQAADADVLELTRARAVTADRRAQRSCDETRRSVEAEQGRVDDLAAEVERLEAAAARRRAAADAAEADDDTATGDTPTPSAAPTPAPAAAPAVSGSAGAAVQFALAQVGKPYSWGGSGPGSYDCSGLTSAAWAAAGVSLPHNSGMQYAATTRVARSAIAPGDLLFYGSPIHHVSMYIGNGQMVEAPRSGLTVRVVSTDRSDYVGAGRP